jgi:hypothetical protein
MNSANDQTRHMALMMQQGVKDAKKWEWGPFSYMRVEYPSGVSVGLALQIGRFSFQIGVWEQCPQLF